MELKMDCVTLLASLQHQTRDCQCRTYTIETRRRRIEGRDEQDKVQLDARPAPGIQRRRADRLVKVGVALHLANVGAILPLVKRRRAVVLRCGSMVQLRLSVVDRLFAHGCG